MSIWAMRASPVKNTLLHVAPRHAVIEPRRMAVVSIVSPM